MNLFAKKINVTNEHLIVDSKHVAWNDILGVRHFDEWTLTQLCIFCPFCELRIRGGKTIRIPKVFDLKGLNKNTFNDKYKERFAEYFSLIQHINNRPTGIRADISSWFEWRILLPGIIFQLIGFFLGALLLKSNTSNNFELLGHILIPGLIGGIVGSIIGFIWEYSARMKKWT